MDDLEDFDNLSSDRQEALLLKELLKIQAEEEKIRLILAYIRGGKKVTKCALEKYLALEKS